MKPESRRAQVRKAEATLNGLLRTPKTRAGLIACVASAKISKHFVFGWLTEQLRTGIVAELKSTKPPSYQISALVVVELPAAGVYPEWLEPRFIPNTTTRRVFLDGSDVRNKSKANSCVS
jgi:hypothetical protein